MWGSRSGADLRQPHGAAKAIDSDTRSVSEVTPTGLDRTKPNTFQVSSLRDMVILSAAESGAVGGERAETDPDLARLIHLWPTLPASARRSILAVAEAAAKACED